MAKMEGGIIGSPAAPAGQGQDFLESILPGIKGLTGSATGVIGNLLNGLPSPSLARTTNAYWGVGAGQPATGGIDTFTGQRGTDLYGQQAQQRQQTGLQDLLAMVGGYASPILGNQGQQFQNRQFNAQLGQNASQFGQNYDLQKFQAMLDALRLGQSINGQNQQNVNL